jgi:hypothetical protein
MGDPYHRLNHQQVVESVVSNVSRGVTIIWVCSPLFRASALSHLFYVQIFVQDVGDARLLGAESDEDESHKLRVEHEERLNLPGNKSAFTFCENCHLLVKNYQAYSFSPYNVKDSTKTWVAIRVS